MQNRELDVSISGSIRTSISDSEALKAKLEDSSSKLMGSAKGLKIKELQQENRQRYSMNYLSYEAAYVEHNDKNKRMLEYMFPGYEMRDPRNWYEKEVQSDLTYDNQINNAEQWALDNEFIQYIEKEPSLIKVSSRDEFLLTDEKVRTNSLAPHGWVGPPLTARLKCLDFLFLEVTNVAKNPRLLKMHKRAIEETTMELKVIPGAKYVPQMVVSIGGKRIFPDATNEVVISENILPKYPSLILLNKREGMLKSGKRQQALVEEPRAFRHNELMMMAEDINQMPSQKCEVPFPDSWTDLIKMEEPIQQTEYKLNVYAEVEEDTEHEQSFSDKPLQTILSERVDGIGYSYDKRSVIEDLDAGAKKENLILYNPFVDHKELRPKMESADEINPALTVRHFQSVTNLIPQKLDFDEETLSSSSSSMSPLPSSARLLVDTSEVVLSRARHGSYFVRPEDLPDDEDDEDEESEDMQLFKTKPTQQYGEPLDAYEFVEPEHSLNEGSETYEIVPYEEVKIELNVGENLPPVLYEVTSYLPYEIVAINEVKRISPKFDETLKLVKALSPVPVLTTEPTSEKLYVTTSDKCIMTMVRHKEKPGVKASTPPSPPSEIEMRTEKKPGVCKTRDVACGSADIRLELSHEDFFHIPFHDVLNEAELFIETKQGDMHSSLFMKVIKDIEKEIEPIKEFAQMTSPDESIISRVPTERDIVMTVPHPKREVVPKVVLQTPSDRDSIKQVQDYYKPEKQEEGKGKSNRIIDVLLEIEKEMFPVKHQLDSLKTKMLSFDAMRRLDSRSRESNRSSDREYLTRKPGDVTPAVFPKYIRDSPEVFKTTPSCIYTVPAREEPTPPESSSKTQLPTAMEMEKHLIEDVAESKSDLIKSHVSDKYPKAPKKR